MPILITAFALWAVIKAAKALHAKHLERKRIEERNRRREIVDRAIRELEESRLIARIQREQERQAKEAEALRKEQERQAAQLEKHEKRLADLEYKVVKIERSLNDIDEKLADYYGQLDSLLLLQAGTVPGSKQFDSYQNKIVTKRDQIRRAESKRFDLMHTREMAQREIDAA